MIVKLLKFFLDLFHGDTSVSLDEIFFTAFSYCMTIPKSYILRILLVYIAHVLCLGAADLDIKLIL